MGGNIVYSRTLPRPSGTVVDGDTISRTGPASTLPTVVEWLGGPGGVIESGTPGVVFSRTNWSRLYAGLSDWTWSTAQPISRSKSLYFNSTANGDGRGTYFFDHGASGFVCEYYSANYYWAVNVGAAPAAVPDMQLKTRRWSAITDVVDHQDPSSYISTFMSWTEAFVNVYDQDPTITRYWGTNPFGGENVYHENENFRLETWFISNSNTSTANGTFKVKVTRLSDGVVRASSIFTNILYRGPLADNGPDRYSVLQNFLGNAANYGYPNDYGDAKVSMDDIYIASTTTGTNAFVRAELVNNATYASATKHAICEVISIVGTTWSVKVNCPSAIFGSSNAAGLYLALFDNNIANSDTPTMVAI